MVDDGGAVVPDHIGEIDQPTTGTNPNDAAD